MVDKYDPNSPSPVPDDPAFAGLDLGEIPSGGSNTDTRIGVPAPVGGVPYAPPTTTDRYQSGPTQTLPGRRTPFETERHTVTGDVPNDLAYTQGMEYGPMSNPEQIPTLQQQLVAAGVLEPKQVRLGVWDNTSANAYKTVLAFANVYGITKERAMQMLIDNKKAGDLTAGSGTSATLTQNPMEIRQQFRATARELTGRELPKDQTDNFTKWYQQREQQAYANLRGLNEAGQGGTTPGAPSTSAAAEEYIRQNNMGDVIAYGTASRMAEFYDMLRSPV